MRVLWVAWSYPPLLGSGTHRTVAIIRWLVAQGHDVTVLTADRGFFNISTDIDLQLEAALPKVAATVRVPFPDANDQIINRWPRERVTNRKAWKQAQEDETLALYPERFYGGWRDRIVGTAYRLQREQPFDLVMATGSAYVDYAVADALNTHFGVPFLMDDRDSFLYSVYTGEEKEPAGQIRAWWEVLAARAQEVWFVNPPIADLYRNDYPGLADRIKVVENGWDGDYFDPDSMSTAEHDFPVFGYVGTLNAKYPLGIMLAGWHAALDSGLPANATMKLFGGLGHRHQPVKQRRLLREARNVIVAGSVTKTEIASAYEQCDVLLFSREGGSLVTTSKVYEYIATGLPIAAVIPADHDSRRVLAGYPRAHIAQIDDPDAWPRVLKAAWADAEASTPERIQEARAYGRQFRRDGILAPNLERVMTGLAD